MSDPKQTLAARHESAALEYCQGNFKHAADEFALLVEEGYAPAATYLAGMYLDGEGVPKNATKAIELLRQAMAWGHGPAAHSLGAWQWNGREGIPKNRHAARECFRLAKELGYKFEYAIDELLKQDNEERRKVTREFRATDASNNPVNVPVGSIISHIRCVYLDSVPGADADEFWCEGRQLLSAGSAFFDCSEPIDD